MTRSLENLIETALLGNEDAQLELGIKYASGDEVETDLKKAKDWLKIPIENDNTMAIYHLGRIYLVEENYDQAIKYLRLTASKNLPEGKNTPFIKYIKASTTQTLLKCRNCSLNSELLELGTPEQPPRTNSNSLKLESK